MSSTSTLLMLRDLAVRTDPTIDSTRADLLLRSLCDGLDLEGAVLFEGIEEGGLMTMAATSASLPARAQELALLAAERKEACLQRDGAAALCLRGPAGEQQGVLWIAAHTKDGAPSEEQCTASEIAACLLGGAITQAQHSQQALWNSAWLARLNDLSRELNRQRSLEGLMEAAATALEGLVAVQECALYITEEAGLERKAASQEESGLPEQIQLYGSSGRVLVPCETGATVTLGRGDLGKRPVLAQLLHGPGSDEAYGLILYARDKTKAAFSAEDELALSGLSVHLGIAIRNVQLMSEIQRQATYDDLTGLAGRRHFLSQVQREIQRAERDDRPLALLMIDADHFKRLNDTYGHAAGDHVLVTLARRLEASVRSVDLVGRLGGEEMGVVLPGASEAVAMRVADRLRVAVDSEPIPWRKSSIDLTVSVGVACWTHSKDAEGLLEQADRALYGAKAAGRDQVVTYSSLDEMESLRDTVIGAQNPSDPSLKRKKKK